MPDQLAQLRARCEAAESRVRDVEQQLSRAVVLDRERQTRMELVMAVHNVPIRGMREIYSVAFGAQAAPSVGTLHAHVVQHGKRARRLLDSAREQVRDTLECVAGDDVFLGGEAVKVVSEPHSNAVLNVGRWPWRKGEDWALWIEEFGGLRLFISDLGSDLVNAVDARAVPHIIDYWHEVDWWSETLFVPLSRHEARLRNEVLAARRVFTAAHGEPRVQARRAMERLERQRATTEREFFFACEAQERLRELYQPLDPRGLPWTEASVAATLAALSATLRRIVHPAGWATREHVERNAARYGTHRVLMDALPIALRKGSPWSRGDVLRALALERELRRTAEDRDRSEAEQLRAERQARRLTASVARHCANASRVRAMWEALVSHPRRSSSGTESFNNRLRVLQVVQRSVSDERMALNALAHNLTVRREGWRRGSSPYQMLGVDFARDGRPWYDVLLEAA
jgi:hypothetical protein